MFRQRGREEERKGEKHQCMVTSPMPPTGDLACNPGMCPDWESNWQPFTLQSSAQSTEPHQLGRMRLIFASLHRVKEIALARVGAFIQSVESLSRTKTRIKENSCSLLDCLWNGASAFSSPASLGLRSPVCQPQILGYLRFYHVSHFLIHILCLSLPLLHIFE